MLLLPGGLMWTRLMYISGNGKYFFFQFSLQRTKTQLNFLNIYKKLHTHYRLLCTLIVPSDENENVPTNFPINIVLYRKKSPCNCILFKKIIHYKDNGKAKEKNPFRDHEQIYIKLVLNYQSSTSHSHKHEIQSL